MNFTTITIAMPWPARIVHQFEMVPLNPSEADLHPGSGSDLTQKNCWDYGILEEEGILRSQGAMWAFHVSKPQLIPPGQHGVGFG